MSTRTVKRLTDLEIDEVSLVDRPANQHGLVAFAKRAEENGMTIYDAAGDEVFEDELQHGDVVYGDDGTEFVFVEDDEDDGTTAAFQSGFDYEDDDALVGKGLVQYARQLGGAARGGYTHGRTGEQVSSTVGAGRRAAAVGAAAGRGVKRTAEAEAKYLGTTGRRVAAGGGTVALAGGGGYGYSRTKKSLGESVYEELSKALTSDDRDQVISKMADEVEVYKSQAEYAMGIAEQLAEREQLAEFTEIAKSYGLPVAPERLGRILKNAVDTMPEADVAELDRLLTAQGELYTTMGSDLGYESSEVMAQVEAMALETVGKADVSVEQATVALFEANPAAYDEYLSEQGR